MFIKLKGILNFLKKNQKNQYKRKLYLGFLIFIFFQENEKRKFMLRNIIVKFQDRKEKLNVKKY